MWIFRSTHKHIGQDTLNEYLDGRLFGRPLERVEQQLGDCDACRRSLEELQATVAMLQSLPMEAPRRSFVMSAPPPEPARPRPHIALRAPNWVYAGAASVAALALAVTISIDATGGLSSGLDNQDFAITAQAPAAESEQATGVSGARSESGPAGQPGIESAASATTDSDSSQDEVAPQSLAAVAAAAPEERSAQGGQEAPAPVAAAAPASQDQETTLAAAPPVAPPAPEISGSDGGESAETSQTAKAESIEEPLEKPLIEETLIDETPTELTPAGEFLDDVVTSPQSVWWRVVEIAAGALVAVSLAGLFFRWRAGRRDSA